MRQLQEKNNYLSQDLILVWRDYIDFLQFRDNFQTAFSRFILKQAMQWLFDKNVFHTVRSGYS